MGRSRSSLLAAGIAPLAPLMVAVLITVEVGTWARGFIPLSLRTRVYPATELTNRLVELCRNGGRVLAVTRRDDWTIHKLPSALLPPNAATAYGYNDVQGYDSLYPATYAAYASWVAPDGYTPMTNGNMVLIDDLGRLAGRGGDITWIVVPAGISPPGDGFARLWEGEGVTLFGRRSPRPRALVGGPYGGHMTEARLAPTRDPARSVFATYRAVAGEALVSETFYPGWHAYVEGRETPVELWGHSFRKIPVAAEATRFEMVYQPASFAVGAFCSLIALSVAACWAVCIRGRNRTRADVEETNPRN